MAKYRLSAKAAEDLDAIWAYTVKEWSEQQAIDYYKLIHHAVLALAGSSEINSVSYDFVKKGLRSYRVGHHVLFYRKEPAGTISVIRILHERMDFRRHL